MLTLPAHRILYALAFLTCVALLASAYYFQYVKGLEPCPLCITQRFFVLLIGLTALMAAIHNNKATARLIYPALIILFATAGAFFAGRMVWLQQLPADQVPACGPSLQYILDNFPMAQAFEVLLRGNGDCAKVLWQFAGLSMPAWVLVAFIGFILLGLLLLLHRNHSK